jgi:hypothetical protein
MLTIEQIRRIAHQTGELILDGAAHRVDLAPFAPGSLPPLYPARGVAGWAKSPGTVARWISVQAIPGRSRGQVLPTLRTGTAFPRFESYRRLVLRSALLRASRRTATSNTEPAAILRDGASRLLTG